MKDNYAVIYQGIIKKLKENHCESLQGLDSKKMHPISLKSYGLGKLNKITSAELLGKRAKVSKGSQSPIHKLIVIPNYLIHHKSSAVLLK